MKKLTFVLMLSALIISCKQEKSNKTAEAQTTTETPKPTTAQLIANAHGFDKWNEVKEIEFTFNGNRHWKWNPNTNEVHYTKDSINLSYNRTEIDSSLISVDKAFINDKFWLLIPFQLVWDKGLTISEPIKASSPINNENLNQITLTYSNQGGYTPGDAYDIFYDDNYIIREWIFRRGNQESPSLKTTFESYQDFKGIKIAMEHKEADGNWNLTFSDVRINLYE